MLDLLRQRRRSHEVGEIVGQGVKLQPDGVVAELGGTASLSYREPGTVFAPYGSATLDLMAKEFNVIFTATAIDATAP